MNDTKVIPIRRISDVEKITAENHMRRRMEADADKRQQMAAKSRIYQRLARATYIGTGAIGTLAIVSAFAVAPVCAFIGGLFCAVMAAMGWTFEGLGKGGELDGQS